MGRLHGCTGKRSDVRYFLKGIPQHIVRPIFVVGRGHINIWYQFPFFKKEKVYETNNFEIHRKTCSMHAAYLHAILVNGKVAFKHASCRSKCVDNMAVDVKRLSGKI